MAFLFVQSILDFLIRMEDTRLSYSFSGYWTFLFVQSTYDFLIRIQNIGLSFIRTGDIGLSYSYS